MLQGGARLGYTLFGDGRSARIRSARAAAAASRAGTRSTAADVAADVAAAYLAVLTWRGVLEAHDRRVAALEAELERARERHEVGKAPRVQVIRAEAESRRAAAAVEATRLRIADAVDEALSALEAGRSRLGALRDAVRQAAEVARIEKLRLEAGRAVQPDYLDAEARLVSARAGRAEAEHAVVRARVRLARITGELDAAWVEEHIRTGGDGR